jgi:HK97 family phage major capsid protein/HK97 family phage prohead protease
VIRGIATTPSPDRVGDIVEPKGVQFKNPMPLLHQHNHRAPVGTVKFDKPTDDGITFEARLPIIVGDDTGELKSRVDTAWAEVKLGLVRGVSIGFRAKEYSFMDDGGIRFTESEVLELSLVTVPANADAVIQTIKSIDAPLLAETGKVAEVLTPPADAGKLITKSTPRPKEGKQVKTFAERIAELEALAKTKSDRMTEIMTKSGEEGRTTSAEEQEEFDTLEGELTSIANDIKRLRVLEAADVAAAKPVQKNAPGVIMPKPAAVVVKAASPEQGIRFAQMAKCLILGMKTGQNPEAIASARYKDDPIILNVVKAAVAAASTGNANWAGNLVGDETSVYADFVEYLRPRTILGRFGNNGIPALRRVPFRVPLLAQTSGGSAYWTGEGKAKPLTKFDFTRTTLEPLKVANIAVLTMEVLRDSSPSADALVRDGLADAIRERLDIDFIDPDKAASAGVSPASILNGVAPIASSGGTADDIRADVAALLSAFIAGNNPPTSGVLLMSSLTALSISMMRNPLGQREFPDINLNGGTLEGLPVITSEYLTQMADSSGGIMALVNASDIYFADEGEIAIDASREASLEMSDAPAHNSTTPTPAQLVSMFQTNSVAIRAERTLNWMRRRAVSVAWLDGVNYNGGS